MIFGSLLLIFAAIGLAVLGVVSESNALLIGSIGASLLAAVGLVVGARQSAAPPSGEDSPLAGGQPSAERLAPVGVAIPAATGTVYGATVTSTSGASGAGPVGSTSPAPAGAAQALPGSPAASAEGAPTGTIPAQAGPSAFPPGAEPPADLPPVDGLAYDLYGVAADGKQSVDAPAASEPELSGSGRSEARAADVPDSDPDDPPGEPAVEPATRAERERAAHLDAEVVVIDGHPRYHLGDCLHLKAREGVETLPISEAEELGFSPCSACAPLRTILSD